MARLRRAEVIVGLVSGLFAVLLVVQLSSVIGATTTAAKSKGEASMSKSNQAFGEQVQSRRRRKVDEPLDNLGHSEANSPSLLTESETTATSKEEERSGLENLAERITENLKGGIDSLKCSLGFQCSSKNSSSTSLSHGDGKENVSKNQTEVTTLKSIETGELEKSEKLPEIINRKNETVSSNSTTITAPTTTTESPKNQTVS